VFSWTYKDLRTYDTSVIKHEIPLKEESKPIRKKLRQINPMLLPIMEKEVKKMLDAQIIVPLRYSEWVANQVPVRIEEWGNRTLCQFQKSEQELKEGKLPTAKDGTHIIEGNRCIQDFHD
jgi:hypothetical protein